MADVDDFNGSALGSKLTQDSPVIARRSPLARSAAQTRSRCYAQASDAVQRTSPGDRPAAGGVFRPAAALRRPPAAAPPPPPSLLPPPNPPPPRGFSVGVWAPGGGA